MKGDSSFMSLGKSLTMSLVVFVGVLAFVMFFARGYASADCGFTGTVHDYAGLQVVTMVQPYGGGAPYQASGGNQVQISEYGYYDSSGAFHSGGRSDSIGGNIVQLSPAGGYPSDDVTNRVTEATFSQVGDCGGSEAVLPGNGTNGSTSTDRGGANWGLDCDNSQLGSDSQGRPLFQMFAVTGVGTPSGAQPGGTWSVTDTNDVNGGAVAAASNGSANTVSITYTEPAPPTAWTLSGSTKESVGTIEPGQSVTFYHYVQNLGPATANNYQWDVQTGPSASGPFSDTSISGTSSAKNQGYNPNGLTSTQTPWPNNTSAPSGTQYCQRIKYWNSSSDHSYVAGPAACVTLNNTSVALMTCNSLYEPGPPPTSAPTGNAPSGSTWSSDAPLAGYVDVQVSGTDAGSPADYQRGTKYTNLTVSSGNPTGVTSVNSPTLNYNPTGSTVTVTVTNYEYALQHNLDSHGNRVWWLYATSSTTTPLTCHTATCSLSVSDGQGPDNVIVAGQPVTVTGTITNPSDPAHPEKVTLPANLPNNNPLSLTMGIQHDVGYPIDVGATSGSIYLGTVTANAGPNSTPVNQTISAYADYFGTGEIDPGSGCSVTFPVYVPFTLTPSSPQVTLHNTVTGIDTDEDPNEVINTTSFTASGPPVSEQVTSTLSSTTSCNIASASTSNDGPFTAGSPTYLYNQYTYPTCNTPLQAGDTYCADIFIPIATGGVVGPGGPTDIVGGASNYQKTCPNVNNKPFFKVYNGGVSAGGSFSATSGGSCSGGGTLAGWNNDTGTNPPPVTSGDFGASSQLNALALADIVGFASAQPPFGQSPTYLSFSNTTNNSGGDPNYSPHLGGDFDPSGSGYCLTDDNAPAGTPALPTNSVGSLASGNYAAGQVSLAGGQINTGHNVSIYATGDVYISNNITYQQPVGGWSLKGANSVPRFELRTTGNIYISPDVTELDGLYIGQGKIYTCSAGTNTYVDGITPASPYAAMAANELFDNCKKQLTVYGGFVASQVNMMRTFGSLRDESVVTGSKSVVTGQDQPVKLNQYSCNGSGGDLSNPYKHSHWYQAGNSLAPPLPAANPADTCPNPSLDGNDGYVFALNDTNFTANHLNGNYNLLCEDIDHLSGGGGDHLLSVQPYNGNCSNLGNWTPVGYIPANNASGNAQPFYDNFDGSPACGGASCTGFHYYSTTDQGEPETPPPGNIFAYVFANPANSNNSFPINGTEPILEAPTPPLLCSNNPSKIWLTCAAEVFYGGPELYLAPPASQNSSSGKWDDVTSLPPVL